MPSLKSKKYNVVLSAPLVLMSICPIVEVAFAKEGNSVNFHQAFSNLVESASKENRHLLNGWNEYIKAK